MDPRIEKLFTGATRWRDEAARVRAILVDCGLGEEFKWGKACYTHDGRNVVILQRMKGFLALLFFRGALLEDPEGLLEEQGKATRHARRLCLTSVEQVARLEAPLRDFVRQAISAEVANAELPERPELVLADELQARLDADPALRAAFEGLTPGRQRAYNLHVSGAKQSKTRARRVEQHVARILAGQGLRD